LKSWPCRWLEGAKNLRKGVVKSDAVRDASVASLKDFVQSAGFVYHGHAPSHLLGPKGNQEYFFNLTTKG
jgi:predicted rRNA methylase YqxC with S4 and FtsJ domains